VARKCGSLYVSQGYRPPRPAHGELYIGVLQFVACKSVVIFSLRADGLYQLILLKAVNSELFAFLVRMVQALKVSADSAEVRSVAVPLGLSSKASV
jgi:hypothetical protein